MKTIVIVIVIAVVLLTAGGFAYAKFRGGCSGPEGRSEWITSRISQRLDLNEGQKAKLETLRQTFLGVRQDFIKTRSEGRGVMAKLLLEPKLDRERAQGQFHEHQEALTGHSGEVIEAVAEFSDSLNPEQRETVVEWLNRPRNGRFGFSHGPRW